MMVKIINTNEEYEEALEQLSCLLQNKNRTPDEENTIKIFLLVIKDFEQRHEEPFELDPIEAIKFRMDQMNLKQKDLIPFIGSKSKVSEILNGKRQLSIMMIRNLNKGLGIPFDSLIPSKKLKSDNLAKFNYSLFPLQEMQSRGCFGNNKKSGSDLKEYAEELVTEFCGDYSQVLEQNIAFLRAPLHRRGKRQINQYNLAIWQICVLKKAEIIWEKIPKFNRESVNLKWLRRLMMLSQYDDGHMLVKEHLEKVGISFIIEPHFPKTYLDGAAILFKGNPIIAVTLRHNRVDNFWFVLAHELAHLIKHMDDVNSTVFFDDLDESKELDFKEQEADSIANEALIPNKIWSEDVLKFVSYEEIKRYAKKAEVNPAIIAGRIRYHKNNFGLFPKLFHSLQF